MTRAMRAESFTGYGALKGSHMKNAKELLEEFTAASFRDPKKAAEMFAEDGAFEMPYLESVGVPGRYEGREAIEGFFRFVREVYPDMDLENVKVMIDTPEQVFAEYEFTAQSSKTGRTVHLLFFGRLVAENGRIKLLRESVNLAELALGVFPNGLADYKVPSRVSARPSANAREFPHAFCGEAAGRRRLASWMPPATSPKTSARRPQRTPPRLTPASASMDTRPGPVNATLSPASPSTSVYS